MARCIRRSGASCLRRARNAGCVGVIIDGAVRDIAKIREMDFPVFARGASPYDSQNRQRVIEFGIPVEIAGVRFCPGDLVFADLDGVVVVPREVKPRRSNVLGIRSTKRIKYAMRFVRACEPPKRMNNLGFSNQFDTGSGEAGGVDCRSSSLAVPTKRSSSLIPKFEVVP